jgi:hypothetical protein
MNKEKEILELIATMLTSRIISLMEELGQKVDKKQAENMIVNVGLFLAEKNKDIILN